MSHPLPECFAAAAAVGSRCSSPQCGPSGQHPLHSRAWIGKVVGEEEDEDEGADEEEDEGEGEEEDED